MYMQGVARTQWYLFNDFHITPLKEVLIRDGKTDPYSLIFHHSNFDNISKKLVYFLRNGSLPASWCTLRKALLTVLTQKVCLANLNIFCPSPVISLSLSLPLLLVTSQLDRSVLLTETKGIHPVQSPATFTPLSLAETPQPGDLAAIDAEFVTLNQVKFSSIKIFCISKA